MRWPGVLALVACNGGLAGDLRFSELEPNGVNIEGSWLEITHLHRTATRSLRGVEVEIGAERFALPAIDIGPGQTFVIGTSSADLQLDQEEAFSLQGALRLLDGEEVLHELNTADFDFYPGSSISRDPEVAEDSWCLTWEAGALDFATPGVLNGPCSCGFDFEFRYRHATDPALDLLGRERLTVVGDQFSLPGDEGRLLRTSDALGQTIEWAYSTGIVYRGSRPYGEEAFTAQPIEIPDVITDFVSGEWTAEPSSDVLCEI